MRIGGQLQEYGGGGYLEPVIPNYQELGGSTRSETEQICSRKLKFFELKSCYAGKCLLQNNINMCQELNINFLVKTMLTTRP